MHSVVEEISINNDWRDGEFAKYKANSLNVEDQLWCRMCIPMIYAHWEGFVVDALKIMLKHLNQLDLQSTQLPTNLVVVSLGDSYRTLSGKQSFEQRINFTQSFNELLDKPVKFKTKVDTKSNLKSNVFEDLCVAFGFDSSKFAGQLNDIDRLVNIRNSIAHGENSMQPDMQNIGKYITSVKNAMDLLLYEIDDYLSEQRYIA
ncbi:MAE_28990/MAE_18760 family HEPN-like nuclease [Vibrio ostreicida]|uniref:MAE_28990/MAE_18760 family HEPN-like nuclease n=1 Tax=Vibrio ostreicida TaxID=526588 RepID=UPI003B5CD6B9